MCAGTVQYEEVDADDAMGPQYETMDKTGSRSLQLLYTSAEDPMYSATSPVSNLSSYFYLNDAL